VKVKVGGQKAASSIIEEHGPPAGKWTPIRNGNGNPNPNSFVSAPACWHFRLSCQPP